MVNQVQASSIRIPTPAPFKGDGNVKHWASRLRSYFAASSCTDEAVKVHVAASLLDGAALDWYLHQEAETMPVPPYEAVDELLNDLEDYFQPTSDKQTAEREIGTLLQTGSVRDYLKVFAELVLRIPDMRDAERRRAFTRGLKPYIQKRVYLEKPETYEDARKIALLYDGVFGKSQHPQVQKTSANRFPLRDANAMDVDAFNVQLKKLSPEERACLAREGGCFACRKQGHIARNCPQFPFRGARLNALDVPNLQENAAETEGSDFL